MTGEQAQNVSVTASQAKVSNLRPLSSFSKGLKVMLRLRDALRPMSLAEISAATGLNKVTTYRFLVTLEQLSFVERVGTDRKFKIGPNAFYVGSGYLLGGGREQLVRVMRRIVSELRHTVTLSVLDGTSVLFIERLDGIDRVKVTVDIGTRVPAYASASGKIILTSLSDLDIKRKFRGVKFQRFTTKTLLSMQEFLRDIGEARKRGFAINDEESDRGLWVIAVPIKNQVGAHIAALAAACPAHSQSVDEQEKLVTTLRRGARDIEVIGIDSLIEGSLIPSSKADQRR
jgi:DNA-binding IclR family transcriptional regulator